LNSSELEQFFRRIQREPPVEHVGSNSLSMWDQDAACALTIVQPEGRAAVMVQLAVPGPTMGRVTAGISLSSLAHAVWTSEAARWEGPGALIACRNEEFLPMFSVVMTDLLVRCRQLQRLPSWDDVLEFLTDWEGLFARTFLMNELDQLGLWGELKLIQRSEKPDEAVSAWIGDSSARTDFMRNSISLEIKTSRRRGQHHVSLAQVESPELNNRAYLVSLWVEVDDGRGESVADLIRDIVTRIHQATEFERKLLKRGYSRSDVAGYSHRWQLLASPRLYSVDHLPRIRQADPGISNIRYLVTLQDEDAVDDMQTREILSAAVFVTSVG
jgi:hypothetical protein